MKNNLKGITLMSFFASTLLSTQLFGANIEQLAQDVELLKANLESNSKSGFQLAGYAAFDYSDKDFSGVKFAPIFHAKYGDIFQFEGELEFNVDSKGETVTELEYAAGTIFLNDYMGLQVGKFMSPVGQFVQNQHPSWINKLPATPVGFGHDGAAPTSNVGVALRGGLPKMGDIRSNYVLFVANASVYGKVEDGAIEGSIDANGRTSSNGAAPTIGGRYAINPVGNMEVGISGSFGQISDVDQSSSTRDYSVFDVDFMYNIDAISLKGEYVQQDIGTSDISSFDTEGGTWAAWYAQASYLFAFAPIEPVIRYSDYHNPELQRNQLALGLNYLFASNLVAKLAFEVNTNEDSAVPSDGLYNEDILRMQLAFGF
ncbi:hypothetical protein JHD49_01210 [Sulfurimonas sp. SAG-AH-194-C21]|nr:hypothetical protein [Sulfurimonas sp. SAG-AH-194-C21]MDF1882552.1 hypothetical protein [Sulfurimonas sp. SAG-AH-194-C21]